MKTYRVARPFNPLALFEALETAGIPVRVVRASHAVLSEPAMYGVVVCESSASDAAVGAVIAAAPQPAVSRDPTTAERNAALAEMERTR